MPEGTNIVSISYLTVAVTLAGTTRPAIWNTALSVRSTFEEKSRGQISQVNPNSWRKISKFYWQSLATFDNKFWIKTLITANTFYYEFLKVEKKYLSQVQNFVKLWQYVLSKQQQHVSSQDVYLSFSSALSTSSVARCASPPDDPHLLL